MAFLSASRRHLCSTTTSTTISSAVAKSRLRKEFDPDRAVAILSSIDPSSPITPTSSRYALDFAVRRLARVRRFPQIESLIDARKTSGPHTEPYLATLIATYGTARMVDAALRTFEELPSLLSSPLTAVSLNALLTACVRSQKPRRALELFKSMSEKYSIAPDAVTYSILIKCHSINGHSEKAFEVFKEMESSGVEPTIVTYTTLLDSLYTAGKAEEAEEFWKGMLEKGVSPDLSSYNVRIGYYALKGMLERVVELIGEVESVGLKPDTVTYNYLVTCYCIDGKFDEAKKLYKEYKGKGCAPNATTFRVLVTQLCRNGDFAAALEAFNDSLKAYKIPDFNTMKVLVEGLVKGGSVEEAKGVIGKMKERFPANLVSSWGKVEKELGLSTEEKVSEDIAVA